MVRRLGAALLIAALGGVAGYTRGALDDLAQAAGSRDDELLYLPNGKYLSVLSLGHANLLADLFYLWAIQYYSDYERADRRRYVEHVFGSVITELDPHYIDAYWLGALILIVETGDLDAGIRLLDRGTERNPDNWILPYLAGWECYHAKDYDRSVRYFELAATIPGAPTAVRRMKAGLTARMGDEEQALQVWHSILEDPASDELSTKIAQRKVRELQTKVDIRALTRLVERFRTDNGRWPRVLEELVQRSYTRALPRDADDRVYAYDPRTGQVSSPAGRLLGEFGKK